MADTSSDKHRLDVFYRRLSRIYESWDETIQAGSILVPVGKFDGINYCKSLSIHLWLFERELPETIIAFTKGTVMFYASETTIGTLKVYKEKRPEDTNLPPIQLFASDNNNSDKKQLVRFVRLLKSYGKTVGIFTEDKFRNPFYEECIGYIFRGENGFERRDISAAIACILAVKDDTELEYIRKATRVAREVSRFLMGVFMNIMHEEPISHKELSYRIYYVITGCLHTISSQLTDIDVDQVDVCYQPIMQSGGNFNMNIGAPSYETNVDSNIAMSRLGVRFKSYCCDIGRTFLHQPTDNKRRHTRFVSSLLVFLRLSLCDGVVLSELYERTISYARRLRPNLVDNLTPDFGYAIGLEPRDEHLVIGPNSLFTAKRNMTFVIRVGLNNLEDPTATSSKTIYYALFQSDTVIVNYEGVEATCLTGTPIDSFSSFYCT